MRDPKRKAPHSTSVINRWVNDYAREHGVAAGRLARWIQFMVVLAILDRARDEQGKPLFLLKGGAAMELRLQLDARTTKDIDAAFRESMDKMLERLDDALQEGWGDFTFERTEPEPIRETRSVRMEIKLSYRGNRWGTVPLEVASAEGRSGDDVDVVEAIDIGHFGIAGPERVPCLSVRYQIAQKIHACTAPPFNGKTENPRFHDLIDLLMLRDLVSDGWWADVREACVDIFDGRNTHPWPPELVVYSSWAAAYNVLALNQGFPVDDVEEAARQVREMIARVDAAVR
jgi:hypothetical protein